MRNFVGTPSMMTALCVYVITSMSAYFTFGSLINSDLILSYPDSDICLSFSSCRKTGESQNCGVVCQGAQASSNRTNDDHGRDRPTCRILLFEAVS